MHADEQAVRALLATWIGAVNAGDLNHLLTLMTDDAVFLCPGQPPFGKEGFPKGFTEGHRLYQLQCTSEIEELYLIDDLAYTVCRDTLTLTPREGGETMILAGNRLTIYRKQADGRWLLARDAHTLT